jgi:dTDP-4-dehydrorhamnose 3,5-epimerase-like enzyme
MEQRANIKFCFREGKRATEIFQLMVTMLSLPHGFLNGIQYFGTAMKILKMMNAMYDQQPFKHLT